MKPSSTDEDLMKDDDFFGQYITMSYKTEFLYQTLIKEHNKVTTGNKSVANDYQINN
jgi:hypothetical protein